MKQVCISIDTCEQLQTYLSTDEIAKAVLSARSILVQLYSDKPGFSEIKKFVRALKATLPHAVVIGATSAGEIANGRLVTDTIVASFSFFDAAQIIPTFQTCQAGQEFETGKIIAQTFANVPDLKGILMLAPAITLNCAPLLYGINDQNPGVLVFGGAAAGSNAQNALVFFDEAFLEQGVVAVGLAGKSLKIETTVLDGWKALGPEITLTNVSGCAILKIDEKPAFDMYSKYLGLTPSDDLFLLEFPLLIERHGMTLARNPISTGKDGRIMLVGDVYSGECARLSYLDIDGITAKVKLALDVMDRFKPQAIFIYSCICRRFTLQEEVELETYPFYELAPVAGFFTHGEFYKTPTRPELLNSSAVLIGIREGPPSAAGHNTGELRKRDVDHYRVRHITVTSRLFHFIGTLTGQLEEANRALKFQAEHDHLTSALNRHALHENLAMEVAYSERFGRPLSMILFDIDHFKAINDQFGHPAGDQVLKCVSASVNQWIRANDTLYRYGGEEFLLILPNTALEGAVVVANKIKNHIASMTISYQGTSLPTITASFGVACYPDHGADAESLLSTLDHAMYHAKGLGRDMISIVEQ